MNESVDDLWSGLSHLARLVTLATLTQSSRDWILRELELGTARSGIDLASAIAEAVSSGFIEPCAAGYRNVIPPPNPRGEEQRVMVGVSYMADGLWRGEDDFRVGLWYQDGRKVVSQMKKAGYEIEYKRFKDGGRTLVKYRLASLLPVGTVKHVTAIPEHKKRALFEKDGYQCVFCRKRYEYNELFPDHRIPTNIAGDEVDFSKPSWMDAFQSVCRVHNYNKREVCKRCPNTDDPEVCRICQWYDANNSPTLVVKLNTNCLEGLNRLARTEKISVQDYVENLLKFHVAQHLREQP